LDKRKAGIKEASTAGKPQMLGEMNKILILELLRNKGALSRAQITRRLDLSFPSVSTNIRDLLEANLVVEIGTGENMHGRKSTLLQYNNKRGFVIGVNMGRTNTSMMLTDLAGDIIARRSTEPYAAKNAIQLWDTVITEINDLLAGAALIPNDLLCIAVGIPGIIDANRGVVRLAPFIEGWESVEPFAIMQEKFQAPILIENNINLGAIGEKWKGAATGYSNIFYFDFGVGIGSAVILNDVLHFGANGAAGEISYSVPNAEKIRRKYSDEGLLEQLIEKFYRKVPDAEKSMTALFELCDAGDKDAEKAIENILRYCATVIINTICVVDPEIIIVTGGAGRSLMNRHQQDLLDMIEKHVPYPPILATSNLGKDANLYGAIAIALQYVHNHLVLRVNKQRGMSDGY